MEAPYSNDITYSLAIPQSPGDAIAVALALAEDCGFRFEPEDYGWIHRPQPGSSVTYSFWAFEAADGSSLLMFTLDGPTEIDKVIAHTDLSTKINERTGGVSLSRGEMAPHIEDPKTKLVAPRLDDQGRVVLNHRAREDAGQNESPAEPSRRRRSVDDLREQIPSVARQVWKQVGVDNDGKCWVREGSAMANISVKEWPEADDTIVHIIASVLLGAPATPGLLEFVARHSNDFPFARLWAEGGNEEGGCAVFAGWNLLGSDMNGDELAWAVKNVCSAADHLDDSLQSAFGGVIGRQLTVELRDGTAF
jgi:hypothetical protein